MKIAITKVNKTYLQLYQIKLHEYYHYLIAQTKSGAYEQLCGHLIFMENTHKVAAIISKKIQQYNTKPLSFKLSITEAIVLQSACNNLNQHDTVEVRAGYQFVCDQIHQQITNIQL